MGLIMKRKRKDLIMVEGVRLFKDKGQKTLHLHKSIPEGKYTIILIPL